MKKIIIITVAFVSVLIAIGGAVFCWRSKPVTLGSITYGWQSWPGVLPYLVAYDQGFFKQEGLDVKMSKEVSYIQEMEKLSSGVVDFVADIALIDLIERDSKGEKLKVVLATDYSAGADGLVAKKEIKNIGELKGKKVAVEMGTLGEYLLYDVLKKNGLSLADVQEVDLPAQEAAEAFVRGEVDAAVLYEPNYSQAVEKGDGWRIYTSVDSPGLIIDVLAFNNDYMASNPTKVSAVVRSYFKAIDFIATNPEQAFAIGAKYFEITPSEFKDQYSGIKQVGFRENQSMLSYGEGASSLHGLIKQTYNFLQTKGAVKGGVDSTEIIVPTFLRELEK